MDKRRAVFISLIGLFQTYTNCPSHILYSSLFVLPLKKEWISKHYRSSNVSNPLSELSLFNSDRETRNFLRLLRWKESQGLLLCMLDEYQYDNTSLIQPFWIHLSNTLCTLYDTVTGYKYNALCLDDKWWESIYSTHKYPSKYSVDSNQILNELYFLTMKYKTIQEIICQSNASLNPIQFYGQNTDYFKRSLLHEESDEDEGEWYISIDYE